MTELQPTIQDLEGKVALVTGASRGIGEAIAMMLAASGADCVLTSRKPEAVAGAAASIVAKGYKAISLACHAGKMDQIELLVKDVERRFGKVDILVNNAATSPQVGPMMTATEAAWDKTFDVNVKGAFFLTQQLVPLIIRAGGGAVVNIASIEGVRPGNTRGVYSMTKAAVVSMTRSWARELAESNIRVNAILPGLVYTRMARTVIDDPEVYAQYMKDIPMHRHGTPDELARAALFLATDASSYMTGSLLTVDGGVLA
jgi:NAD(P)-dependent dehydrogenase (short-subunit alcohol dehydrogenase family)